MNRIYQALNALKRNSAVLRNVLTWANFLQPKIDDWFATRYPLLTFGPLFSTTLEFGIVDEEWLAHAEADEAKDLEDDLGLSLELYPDEGGTA